MNNTTNETPYGYCQCGCGQKTRIATQNNNTYGHVKGEPVRFVKGHGTRLHLEDPNPSGLCLCGCGQLAPIAKFSRKDKGHVAGKPLRFIPGHNSYARTMIDNFWNKVDKRCPDECWNWIGQRSSRGYGKLQFSQKDYAAHRFSYELHNCPIPDGLFVCHKCDNPLCVNPRHLWLGTHQDNMNDMVFKDRNKMSKGENHKLSKLTNEQVKEIRELYQTNMYRKSELAKMYHVGQSTIGRIIANKVYIHD